MCRRSCRRPRAAGSPCPRRAPGRMRALGSYSRRAAVHPTASRQPGKDGRDAERGLQECCDKGTLHHICYALERGCFPRDPLRAPSRALAPLSLTLKAQICLSKAICFMHTRAAVRRSLRTALQLPPKQTALQQNGFTFAPPRWDCSRTSPNPQHPNPQHPNPRLHPAQARHSDPAASLYSRTEKRLQNERTTCMPPSRLH